MSFDLMNDLQQKDRELTASIKQLRISGSALAEAERNYKIKLREEALKLRAEKGMAVTLINQIVYGVPEVLENQIDREWGHTKKS